MRVALVSSNDSEINIISEIKEYLASKITNLDVSDFVLDSVLDIPKKVSSLHDYDLIFISFFYGEDSNQVEVVLTKLIDFEISSDETFMKDIRKIKSDDFELTDEKLVLEAGKRIETTYWCRAKITCFLLFL